MLLTDMDRNTITYRYYRHRSDNTAFFVSVLSYEYGKHIFGVAIVYFPRGIVTYDDSHIQLTTEQLYNRLVGY